MNATFKTVMLWMSLLVVVFLAWHFAQFQKKETPKKFSEFMTQVEAGQVADVTITGNEIKGHTVSREAFRTFAPVGYDKLVDTLLARKVTVNYQPDQTPTWANMLISWAPFLLLIGFWIFFMRQMQSGGNKALSFGKSKARLLASQQKKVTFKDVAGVDEAKEELQEIIEFLKEPQKFQKLGGRIPKGVLLMGAPGTGKTLLARAISGEANVPFFSISGSDFVEMFVGVGASRVRDLFEQGKKNAPCLTGDAVVTLASGRRVTIQEMFEKAMVGVEVPAMGDDFSLTRANVLGITRKVSTDVYRVRTMHGEARATGNHLFPVLRHGRLVWTRADALTVGDHVAMPRHLPAAATVPRPIDFLPAETRVYTEDRAGRGRRKEFIRLAALDGRAVTGVRRLAHGRGGWTDARLPRVPEAANERLLYLVGLIEADGSWKSERSIPFVNTCPELHDAVAAIVAEEFGVEARRSLMRRAAGGEARDVEVSYLHGRLLKRVLEGLGERVLEMQEPLVAAWLRGVFDGDGCVQDSKVVLSAWQEPTNRRVRVGLHRLGIVPYDSGRLGNIEITGKEDVARFAERVGSSHPEKAARLAEFQSESRTASRADGIPVGALLREARLACGMGQRAFKFGNYVSVYERGQVVPPRTRVASLVAEMEACCAAEGRDVPGEVEALRRLAEGNTRFTPVAGVDAVPGEHFVYDLCLDGPHNFVANGLFVHNCIIFIDEIDAVGRHRGAGLGGGHDEREQTLNQLLVEMDGFESNDGVILIAATNRPDVLDPALLRPGRFDRRVVVSRPDVRGREGILQVHTRKIPLSEDVDIAVLARATPGFSGADLANLVNEAALMAARHNQKFVVMSDFESSKDKVLMGAERKSLIITDEEKRITAFHEAGHALLASLVPHSDPIHKVTIIPRGMALGLTQQLPTEEKHNWSKEQIEARLAVLMGGRIAEEMTFGQITTGAQNDIEQATEIARKMACEWGMSEALGPLTYGKKEEAIFLGKEFNRHQDYSEATALRIDAEIKRIVSEQYARATRILGENRSVLARVAEALLEHEVLDAPQLKQIISGEPLEVKAAPAPTPPREVRVEEGERAPGLLPPPVAAPKPTS